MEKFNKGEVHIIPESFAKEERKQYKVALERVRDKIDLAYQSLVGQIDEIEVEMAILPQQQKKFMLWPIEEINEFINEVPVDAKNIKLFLALREALFEKVDNLKD
jgi:hypothetical protein